MLLVGRTAHAEYFAGRLQSFAKNDGYVQEKSEGLSENGLYGSGIVRDAVTTNPKKLPKQKALLMVVFSHTKNINIFSIHRYIYLTVTT